MLPKKHRFPLNSWPLPGKYRNFETDTFRVLFKPSDFFQASVIVNKKQAKLAVDRNKLRRRLLSSVRKIFGLNAPVTLVFWAKTPLLKLKQTALVAQLQHLKSVVLNND